MSEYSPYHLLRNPSESDGGGNGGGVSGYGIVPPGCVQEFNDVQTLIQQIKGLFLSTECSDIVLVVEGKRFPAHRTILACRSEYFRAMFYGGMREERDAEVVLHETPVAAFEILLNYFYSGKLRFNNLKMDMLLDVFGLVHQYGVKKLEEAMCDYLKHALQPSNVAVIYATAHLFSLDKLSEDCLDFMDKCATEVLNTEAFLQLSGPSLLQIMVRNSFCASELHIFQVLAKWIDLHAEEAEMFPELLKQVRLSLIKLDDLMREVRPTGLIDPERLLDTINDQTHKRTCDLGYRGFKKPNTNVVSSTLGAAVIEGNMGDTILKQEQDVRDREMCTSHEIGGAITVELGQTYIINHIDMQMVDRDQRFYSYYIEVSMDKNDWSRVINYVDYLCRGRQKLYFPERVVKYIRVVCTRSVVHRTFYISSLKAMFSTDVVNLPTDSDILVPTRNVATVQNNAYVLEGVSRSRNALLNGITDNYDWDNGYTCHQLGSGWITVQLPQPYIVGSMRLLLWDCDDRLYSFDIEVSHDNENYIRIIKGIRLRSWQTFYFKPLPVVFVRIVGTENTANEVFHCVHFECPADPSNAHTLENDTAHPPDLSTYPVMYGKPAVDESGEPGPSNRVDHDEANF